MASANDRSGKRSRFGNRQQRSIWKSAHAWKHVWYPVLSAKSKRLNDMSSAVVKTDAKLNRDLQAKLDRCSNTNDKVAVLDTFR